MAAGYRKWDAAFSVGNSAKVVEGGQRKAESVGEDKSETR